MDHAPADRLRLEDLEQDQQVVLRGAEGQSWSARVLGREGERVTLSVQSWDSPARSAVRYRAPELGLTQAPAGASHRVWVTRP